MARSTTIKWEIVNLEEFIADLERMEAQAERGMGIAIHEEARQQLDRSQILVPVDTGALKGSGFVGTVQRWARGLEVKFGYGSPYAIYQHYGNYEHDDGRKNFLADPVKYSRRGLVARIKATLGRYLR